ncbi:MAG TPA: periplasmic heavy metal sensor [Azospirillaceae bacterium]|nr:periplasmic heavy metal sensor [Azospirillaceae bacterium]
MTRTVKLLIAGLVLSLSVNLLVGGMMVGHHLTGRGHAGGEGRGPGMGFMPGLSREMRPYVRAELEARREEGRQRIQAIREARREAGRVLRSEPFDRAAAAAALARLREVGAESQVALHEALLEAFAKAPPEARTAAPEERRERRRRDKPEDGPSEGKGAAGGDAEAEPAPATR